MSEHIPFFSIIVPVYNQKKYLSYCIDSVLNQTINDYEIIIVDDGSTDGSAKLCADYQRKYPDKIRSVHQDHEGVFAARAKAFRAAKGNYVLFLDSDDAYRCDALEILVKTIEKDQVDIVLYKASVSADFKIPYGRSPFERGQMFQGTDKEKVYSVLCSTHLLNSLCFKCIRKRLFYEEQDFDGKFESGGYGEDLYLSIPVMNRAETIVFLNDCLYFYRQHTGSTTRTYAPWQWDSIKIVCKRLYEYAKVWEKEYGVKYQKLVDSYCQAECYSTIKNIGSSHLSIREKKKEIGRLKSDTFFQHYSHGIFRNKELNIIQKLLFAAFCSNFSAVLVLLNIGLKLIYNGRER